nr:nucleotidyltransferase family protein [Leucobacter edaphi]
MAGGRGSRLGGRDKAAITLGGERLVDRAVSAARDGGALAVIVAGPAAAVPPGCIGVREEPAYGGPLAALAAALERPEAATATETLLLSCDLVDPAAVVGRLSGARWPAGADALVLRDPDGREQWLAGRYRLAPLREGVTALGAVSGLPIRQALSGLRIAWLDTAADDVADIDTPEDLDRARARSELGAD